MLTLSGQMPWGEDAIPYAFEWVVQNVEYDHLIFPRKEYSAKEAFVQRTGVCIEASYCLASLLRLCGVNVNIAIVKEDYTGKKVSHACVAITHPDGEVQLVDVTYKLMDVRHRSYFIASDFELSIRFQDAHVHPYAPGSALEKLMGLFF
jgi:hypothetical protein